MTKTMTTLTLATLLLGSAAALPQSAALADQVTLNAGSKTQRGQASWYGPGFHGRLTANGERFNSNAMTAAHRTLPFGTRVRVVNQRTGRSVVVRINDRGPYAHGRIIDLSAGSARALGVSGVASVVLAAL